MRSGIGLPARKNGVLKSLGLRRRQQTVYFPVSQDVAGKIMRVKELLDVQEVETAMTHEEMKEARRPSKGYYIETSATPS